MDFEFAMWVGSCVTFVASQRLHNPLLRSFDHGSYVFACHGFYRGVPGCVPHCPYGTHVTGDTRTFHRGSWAARTELGP